MSVINQALEELGAYKLREGLLTVDSVLHTSLVSSFNITDARGRPQFTRGEHTAIVNSEPSAGQYPSILVPTHIWFEVTQNNRAGTLS